jgi:cytochrome c-type biogenesis protein
MNPNDVTVGLAFLAGLASFLSPCVLALVPAYIGYLGGWSVSSAGEVTGNRWSTFAHGLAFVIGFSIVFISLGAVASALGTLLYDIRIYLARIGGVLLVIFGLHTMGVITIPLLNYDTRRQVQPDRRLGIFSSVLMGVFFSAGWSPCVGPILGGIYTLALSSANLSLGVILLAAYSIGLAIPFLLAALGIGRVAELMRKYSKWIRVISIATGVVLIVLGIMLYSGTLEKLAQYGLFVDFGL